MAIPPLSQSRYEDMACPYLYVEKHVFGNKMPGTSYSRRGTEIHDVLSAYVDHLLDVRKPADWAFYDALCAPVGVEANGILSGFRDRFELDVERVVATETYVTWGDPESEGTIDVLLMVDDESAVVVDYKSYFQIFDPETHPTFQSQFYPLLVMLRNGAIQSVRFDLIFVRYGVTKSVTYTREDLPRLLSLAKDARVRQEALHAAASLPKVDGAQMEATPGSHCVYCPLLRGGCPLEDRNVYAMPAEDRLRRQVFLEKAIEENRAILRDFVQVAPVKVCDANGSELVAENMLTAKRKIPLISMLEVIEDWKHASEDHENLAPKLFVASTELRALRGAKKRVVLDQAITDIEVLRESVQMVIRESAPSEVAPIGISGGG